ncbi:zinc transporter ZIP6 [Gastrophryne carolinensis]
MLWPFVLLAALLSSPGTGTENSTMASGLDPVLALRAQRHNLLLLFRRYGENNQSLSVEGFRKLFSNLMEARRESGHHLHHHVHHHPHQHEQHHAEPASTQHATTCEQRRRKRRHVTGPAATAAPESVMSTHGGVSPPGGAHAECLNASQLLALHGMEMQMLLGPEEFHYLCPAIINQVDRKSCPPPQSVAQTSQDDYSVRIAWLGGFISITVISVLSLLGIILVPMMNKVFFKFLLSFLVALAVGTLSGDAFLHLLPHSLAKHRHNHDTFENQNHEHEQDDDHLDATWKGLTALGGLYFMFLVEHFITLIKQYKDKKQKSQKKNENTQDFEIKKQLSNHSHAEEKEASETDSHHESYIGGQAQEVTQFQAQPPNAPEEEEEEIMIAKPHDETESYREYVSKGCENKCHSHLHDTIGQSDERLHHHHDYHHILHHHHHQNHHPHSHSQRYSREELKDAGIATLAWMVIMGDGLHNFSDGLAIGAAFTDGLSSGLSTSVAVFCHELPHELGDFAILLKAGMTVKQAVLYNALSAMLAYLGMITGILIGHYAENVSMWIFALTAGLFIYVAFVDMVPEMLHNDAIDHGCSRWGYFFLQNAGILLGFGLMLVISIFEHKLVFTINL